jgi:hypothetical protein
MRRIWKRIRSHWTRTDTLVLAGNLVAFGLFIGNCWWESIDVTYAALAGPMALQAWRSRRDATLRDAIFFGLIVGALWPVGEWLVVNVFGWWGEYLAPGLRLLETPLYCVLIGAMASTYCAYVGLRAVEMGFSLRAAVVNTGLTAFFVGLIGENLFVGGRMWVYDASRFDWWYVPAFVPIAYGLGYALLPALRTYRPLPRALILSAALLVTTVGLGLLVGFFPR